jgi:hypothetical protein
MATLPAAVLATAASTGLPAVTMDDHGMRTGGELPVVDVDLGELQA